MRNGWGFVFSVCALFVGLCLFSVGYVAGKRDAKHAVEQAQPEQGEGPTVIEFYPASGHDPRVWKINGRPQWVDKDTLAFECNGKNYRIRGSIIVKEPGK